MVEPGLVGGIAANDRARDLAVHVGDRLGHALAAPAALVAVAQLDRFMDSGRRPRRNRRAAQAAIFEDDVDLDGRIAAAVEDLAAVNAGDCGHGVLSCASVMKSAVRDAYIRRARACNFRFRALERRPLAYG